MGAVVVVFDLMITERWPARSECWNGVKLQQQQQYKSVGGHSEPCRCALPHAYTTRSPSDLLMVHACAAHTQ